MRLCVLLVMLASCVESSVVTCGDGRVCPVGTACDEIHGACVTPQQLVSCVGREGGESCDIAATGDGICDVEVCVVAGCGDGYRRGDEACDGNDVPAEVTCLSRGFYDPGAVTCNDACGIDDSTCTGFCGDHMVNPAEEVCEEDIAPTLSCVDFGYGAGVLGCNMCAPGLDDCRRFGWESAPLPFEANDVHGTSDENVFVVGTAAVAHFDGKTWTQLDLSGCSSAAPLPTLGRVWAIGPREAFVTGAAGTLLHLTAAGCTRHQAPTANDLYNVWASSPTDVYALGGDGIWRFTGTGWSLALAGSYSGIWGSSANNIFVAGTSDTVVRYTGTWSTPEVVPGLILIGTIWGTSANEVYLSGRDTSNKAYVARFDGSTWSPSFTSGALLGAGTSLATYGSSGGGTIITTGFVIAGDVVPFLMVGDATGWTYFNSPTSWIANSYVSPTGRAYVVASGSAYVSVLSQIRFDATVGTEGKPRSIGARGSSEVFVGGILGTNATYRWNGFTWSVGYASASLIVGVGPQGATYGVTRSGGQGIFAYTPGTSTWANVGAIPAGRALSVLGPSSVWYVKIVDSGPDVVGYWTGGHFPAFHPLNDRNGNAADMTDVWAASPSAVFAVGSAGTIQRWNGSAWEPHLPPTTADLVGVWGLAANNVYAWGGTTLLHYDGTSWTAMTSWPANTTPLGLWAESSTDVFVITKERGLLRYNGDRWAAVSIGTSIALFDIVGVGNSIFVTDEAGGVHQLMRTENW